MTPAERGARIRALAIDFGGTLASPGPAPDGTTVTAVLNSLPDVIVPPGFAAAFDAVHRASRRSERLTCRHTPFSEKIRSAAEATGASVPDPLRAATAVFEAVPDATVSRTAAAALHGLRQRGLVCVLACDTQRPEALRRRTLADAGIAECFDALVLSSTLGVRKPHPGFYNAVVAAAGCAAQNILFVGDTRAKDVIGPRTRGMHAVLVSPDEPSSTGIGGLPDAIGHFAELPTVLESFNAH